MEIRSQLANRKLAWKILMFSGAARGRWETRNKLVYNKSKNIFEGRQLVCQQRWITKVSERRCFPSSLRKGRT